MIYSYFHIDVQWLNNRCIVTCNHTCWRINSIGTLIYSSTISINCISNGASSINAISCSPRSFCYSIFNNYILLGYIDIFVRHLDFCFRSYIDSLILITIYIPINRRLVRQDIKRRTQYRFTISHFFSIYIKNSSFNISSLYFSSDLDST